MGDDVDAIRRTRDGRDASEHRGEGGQEQREPAHVELPPKERVCRRPTPLPGRDPTSVTLTHTELRCGYPPDFAGDG